MTTHFEEALRVVAELSSKPKFAMWQPVWPVDSLDARCYIIIGIHRPMFGAWRYDVVLETDPTGPVYGGLENYFTDKPPATPLLHPEHRGSIYFTNNGRPLKSVEGGFPELRAR